MSEVEARYEQLRGRVAEADQQIKILDKYRELELLDKDRDIEVNDYQAQRIVDALECVKGSLSMMNVWLWCIFMAITLHK